MASDTLSAQIVANRAAIRTVRARVIAYVTGIWLGLGTWNVDDVDRFVALVLPAVLAGQRTTASLTDSYLALVATQALGEPVAPVGLPDELVSGSLLRNGTPPELVYRRGGAVVWEALAQGMPLQVAVDRGLTRVTQAAATDMQLAKTHASQVVLAADRQATGYRRVLTGGYSCGLCALASTRRYHVADLLPIHPSCDCDVEPIFGADTVALDPAAVEKIHALARDFFGDSRASGIDRGTGQLDYRDFVIVHDHGEYGPVLARKGDAFQGPQ